MSRLFPALDVSWTARGDVEEVGELLAALDDSAPTAVETLPDGVRVFFSTAADRDRGLAAIRLWNRTKVPIAVNVPDEDWAARSQADLRAIRVGDILVAPPWDPAVTARDTARLPHLIVIQPSMGFGTGHHASTRLCLLLLQADSIAGASALDVGTGLGVLAIAASKLGARHVTAIDSDPDAVRSAEENIALNHALQAVTVRTLDFATDSAGLARTSDLVTANLTGAMLERFAPALAATLTPAGRLIASGFQIDEEAGVTGALNAAGLTVDARVVEEDWVAITVGSRRVQS